MDISLGGNVVNGHHQFMETGCGDARRKAGIEGLPQDVQPVCIGRGRYRAEFADGAAHRLARAEKGRRAPRVHAPRRQPTGGILVVSGGIQGIGVEVQWLLADGALGFRVRRRQSDAVQYLHAGTARPMQGIVEVALSNGNTIMYRCGRTPDAPDGGTSDGDGAGSGEEDSGNAPVIFQCEEHGQCSV